MSAGRTDPAGRGVRLTTLRCAPMTGPRVRVCERCVLQKLRKLMLPDSCLFSNFQLPVAPVEWPPPNPRWGRHSAVRWNLRSEPPDVTPYFCRGGADKISRVSFRRHVTNTNLRDRKRYPALLRCPWFSESFPAVMDVKWVQRREIHFGYKPY